MNSFENIELFIFDCDGVLVDTEQLANRVFIEEITKFGFHLTSEEAWEHFPGSRFASCIEYVEKTNGRPVPPEFADIYRSKTASVFAHEMEAIPGIRSVLDRLQLPKVVASNGPTAGIIANLRSASLFHYFQEDQLYSAYTFQKWKPEPDMHLHVSSALQVDPSKCLVIEDSVPGVQAAISAGMQVIGFTHDGRNRKLSPLNIPTIDRLEELFELVPLAWHSTSEYLSFP
ncbi:MAG: HAD family hydrolase [Saprospiraceae bacterium]